MRSGRQFAYLKDIRQVFRFFDGEVAGNGRIATGNRIDHAGSAHDFVVEYDGKEIARIPEKSNNPFGRGVFQGLQYSDTPPQPLATMRMPLKEGMVPKDSTGKLVIYSVNTFGLTSAKTAVKPR